LPAIYAPESSHQRLSAESSIYVIIYIVICIVFRVIFRVGGHRWRILGSQVVIRKQGIVFTLAPERFPPSRGHVQGSGGAEFVDGNQARACSSAGIIVVW
jgi:hypothetical protein